MRLLQPGYRFTPNERWILLLLVAGSALLAASLRFLGLVQLLPDCPIHQLLGLHCPGCGMGRAAQALARLDVAGIWHQNPLLLIALPYVLYRFVTILVGIGSGRWLATGWPRWLALGYQYLFIAVWLLLAIVRTATWIRPEINPAKLGIPAP